MIYADPFWCRYPEGQAKLISHEYDHAPDFECWNVEFLDLPGKIYKRLIKNTQSGSN
jgi:hypothetical protein